MSSFFFNLEEYLSNFNSKLAWQEDDLILEAFSKLLKITLTQSTWQWYVLPLEDRLLWLIQKIEDMSSPEIGGKFLNKLYIASLKEIFAQKEQHEKFVMCITEAVIESTSGNFDEWEIAENMLHNQTSFISASGEIFRALDPGMMALFAAWAAILLELELHELKGICDCENIDEVYSRRKLKKVRHT